MNSVPPPVVEAIIRSQFGVATDPVFMRSVAA